MDDNLESSRLMIVSNRLPVVFSREDGKLKSSPGSGGLVTALAPVLKNRGGIWVGWPGFVEGDEQEVIQEMNKSQKEVGFSFSPVFLTKEDVDLYYNGFANEVIWPLFHDLQSDCRFDPKYWTKAQEVTHKFALAVQKKHKKNDFTWVHDYHLILLGGELRKLNITSKLAFFLHIPFPAPDIFLKLPWRFQILRALLEYDLIGFQTMQDQKNFVHCLRKLLPDINLTSSRGLHFCELGEREIRIGSFPISIDFNAFSKSAAKKEIANHAKISHEKLSGQKIIFSLDRLDITKGIPYRLEAIRDLLKHHPELHAKITFIQVVIPSRTDIPKYQNLKNEVDRLVGEINSQFTQAGWVPIEYLFRPLTQQELLAFYRTSEIVLVTPVRDGMNLVSKEFVASNVEENGVLILSEFAGAAAQFQHEAFLVNPYDIEGLSKAIFDALQLPKEERKKRMKKMRRNTKRHDIFRWVRLYLRAAFSKDLQDFPVIQEYVPTENPPEQT
ncbi:alpha,alpha-trehalose-phosphate synthase (UDP-forming) [Parachlamydia acanthamoebae]|jgi:trehalose 6-phosphate synthase|uniref:alpha,alpha-trehalose-phosphate synthase (UDP-forming) n=1 Tax=Parachlamydia acanthamoebae TaxID=83552 RepID=UPI0001C17649|nr:trehalose-6-phosphate synthase [Parachlamydia acanthamoebae]EFB42364.1 hypothetical protein pah_c010o066 [Parachlamydia acanthamoebae str. Hall's coccus]